MSGIGSTGRNHEIVRTQQTQTKPSAKQPSQPQAPEQSRQPQQHNANDQVASRPAPKNSGFSPSGVNFNRGTQAARSNNLDTPAVFNNANAATPAQIDKILEHYNSPFKGKGQEISDMAKKYNVNPVMLLAIMQQESTFGKASSENQANPFSILEGNKTHRLRHRDDTKFTFTESLEGAARILNEHGSNSSRPLTNAGQAYCKPSAPWITGVAQNFRHLQTLL